MSLVLAVLLCFMFARIGWQ